MNVKTTFAAFAIAVGVVGCAHPTWIPYAGGQQDWPISPGAFTDTNRSLLVYYGNPPVPYIVLGQIQLWTQTDVVDLITSAANAARDHGADAIIVGPSSKENAGGTFFGSGFANNGAVFATGFAAPITQRDQTVVAIKWKNSTGNPQHTPPPPPVAQNRR